MTSEESMLWWLPSGVEVLEEFVAGDIEAAFDDVGEAAVVRSMVWWTRLLPWKVKVMWSR